MCTYVNRQWYWAVRLILCVLSLSESSFNLSGPLLCI